jgi:hypothetical protein
MLNMAAQPPSTVAGPNQWSSFVNEQRHKVDEFVARQQAQLLELSQRMAGELEQLSSVVQEELNREVLEKQQVELQARQAELVSQHQELTLAQQQTERELTARATELNEREQHCARRENQLQATEQLLQQRLESCQEQQDLLEQQQSQLASQAATLLVQTESLASTRAELVTAQSQFQTHLQELQACFATTLTQRQKIAQQLWQGRLALSQEFEHARTELEQRRQALHDRAATLSQQEQELQAALQVNQSLREELINTQQEQRASLLQLRKELHELTTAQQALHLEQQALQQSRQQIAQYFWKQRQLFNAEQTSQQAAVEQLRQQLTTQIQHYKLAQEAAQQELIVWQQEHGHLAEVENTRHLAHEQELATLQHQISELQAALNQTQRASNAATDRQQQQRIAELEAKIAAQAQEINASHELLDQAIQHPATDTTTQQLQTDNEQLRQQLKALELGQAENAVQVAQVRTWETERHVLQSRLYQAEEKARLAEEKLTQQAALDEDPQRIAELQKRFELAIEDVRSLKRKNNELESQLQQARQAGRSLDLGGAEGSWENLKKKMMAQLESDDNDLDSNERIQIEQTIKRTEAIVAAKDRELADLRQLLEEQSSQVGDLAVGAAAIAQIFDHDELIQAERERLQQAQDEWREKLKKAEIDISLERARLARERLELEEKVAQLQKQQPTAENSTAQTPAEKTSNRGRWLARLGLKDNG